MSPARAITIAALTGALLTGCGGNPGAGTPAVTAPAASRNEQAKRPVSEPQAVVALREQHAKRQAQAKLTRRDDQSAELVGRGALAAAEWLTANPDPDLSDAALAAGLTRVVKLPVRAAAPDQVKPGEGAVSRADTKVTLVLLSTGKLRRVVTAVGADVRFEQIKLPAGTSPAKPDDSPPKLTGELAKEARFEREQAKLAKHEKGKGPAVAEQLPADKPSAGADAGN